MSDNTGRYRRLYTRLWRHPAFAALTEGEKVLALYALTGPQTNRLGLYMLSIATAAEDLGTLPQTLTKRLANVCLAFGWLFDSRARVFYVPSWFKWNPPENVNVMKGSLKDLNEIPPCGLVDAFAQNLETLPDTLRETFVEGLRQRLPKRSPTQEQYQESETGNQEQKHEPSVLRTGALPRSASPKANSKTKNGFDGKLLPIAREVLSCTNPNAPLEHLLDAFGFVYGTHGHKGSPDKSGAIEAINAALAERRRPA